MRALVERYVLIPLEELLIALRLRPRVEYKLYCIFAEESVKQMKGSRGKLGTQAGHAYLHTWWEAWRRFPLAAHRYKHSRRAYKITLLVATTSQLEALQIALQPYYAVSPVVDAGLTVFDGPTYTCLGVGPVPAHDPHPALKALKVLT